MECYTRCAPEDYFLNFSERKFGRKIAGFSRAGYRPEEVALAEDPDSHKTGRCKKDETQQELRDHLNLPRHAHVANAILPA
jgi:hypothetical protein